MARGAAFSHSHFVREFKIPTKSFVYFYDRWFYDNQLLIQIRLLIIVFRVVAVLTGGRPIPSTTQRNHIVDKFPFCLPFA